MDRYAAVHDNPQGPGDARPTAEQVGRDQDLIGNMPGKTVLVTGGTAGLGTETARVLHMTGAKIFITARSAAKGVQVASTISKANPENPAVEVVEMDLNSLASVRAGANDFLKRSSQLNVLITNAGVMASPEGRTADGFETQFGTNHLAHFLLFKLLKPTLLASSTSDLQSRVVVVSSSGHRSGGGIHPENYNQEGVYQPFVAYGQSKTANVYMATEIERRYGNQGLHAFALHPGVIFDTSLANHLKGGAEAINKAMQDADARTDQYKKSTPQGTATQVWAAVAKELEGKGGLYLDDVQVAKEVAEENPPGVLPGWKKWIWDQEMAMKLWDDSLKMVGLAEEK